MRKNIFLVFFVLLFSFEVIEAQNLSSVKAPFLGIPKKMNLIFTNAYLYYNVRNGIIFEDFGGVRVSLRSNWGVYRSKSYLFHIHHLNMGNHFWEVNTSRQIFFTADGDYQVSGGSNYSPIIKSVQVKVFGNNRDPNVFKLFFQNANILVNTESRKVIEAKLYDTDLTSSEDWRVCKGKTFVDIQNKMWPRTIFWRVVYDRVGWRLILVKRGFFCEKVYDYNFVSGVRIKF